MIDKTVLKRLITQSISTDNLEECLDDNYHTLSDKNLLKLARACEAYGKSQYYEPIKILKDIAETVGVDCEFWEYDILLDKIIALTKSATGEWKEYPQNKPKDKTKYLFEWPDGSNWIGYVDYSIEDMEQYFVGAKRFAEINQG